MMAGSRRIRKRMQAAKHILRCAIGGKPIMYVDGELTCLERFLSVCMGVVVIYV